MRYVVLFLACTLSFGLAGRSVSQLPADRPAATFGK